LYRNDKKCVYNASDTNINKITYLDYIFSQPQIKNDDVKIFKLKFINF